MARQALTGTRIRERRTLLGMKQAELARRVAVSASYLNLIEHNRRRIGGKLLSQIAQALRTDLETLTQGAEAALIAQLAEAAAESGAGAETDRIDEFIGRYPGWARLVAEQARQVEDLQGQLEALSDRLSHDPRLASAMHEVLSKVTSIRSAAAILVETEDIDEAWRGRFERNLHGDSLALAERAQELVTFLDTDGQSAGSMRAATPWEELELLLRRRQDWLADLEEAREPAVALAAMLEAETGLTAAGRRLASRVLFRAVEEAASLPWAAVAAFRALPGGDPAAWAAERGVPVAVAVRRLALAPAVPGQDAPGYAMADASGAILLHRPAPAFLMPRAGQACPLWPLYEALGAPGRPVSRALAHGAAGGGIVRAHAVAETTYPMGAGAPPLAEAWMILVPETVPPAEPVLPVGSACRICARPDCVARQEASVLAPGL